MPLLVACVSSWLHLLTVVVSASSFSVHVWKRVSDGGRNNATWMLGNTIELRKLLSLKPMMHLRIMGLDEDNNVIFKLTDSVVFTVNLESLQFKKLSTQLPFYPFSFHPFKSFYTPGKFHVYTLFIAIIAK
jgi:hypothetical protein